MLVVGHSHAVLEQVVQAAADVVGPLHILEHHPQGGGEHVGLVYPLVHTGLHHGNAVGAAGRHGAVDRAAGDTIGHAHGGHVIHPAAAGLDYDVPGIGKAGQWLADQGVALLQLTH